jgi:hypothetical protein
MSRGARPTRQHDRKRAADSRGRDPRWVRDNAMADGSCAPLAATLAGDVLRTAAYTFWKAARRHARRKLRWVCKGTRKGSGPEARPQAAADGAREAATPTANAAGLQPAQHDGARTSSEHQQHQAPGAATSNQGPVGHCPPLPSGPSPPPWAHHGPLPCAAHRCGGGERESPHSFFIFFL